MFVDVQKTGSAPPLLRFSTLQRKLIINAI